MGSLHIVLGPMFSGKTTKLIQIYKTRTYSLKNVAVINYADDTRYDSKMLSTHDEIMIPCIQLKQLADFDCSQYDTILINEGQFFGDLYENVLKIIERFHKEVFIFGLDGDFLRNKFGSVLDLIPYSDTVEKLSALCAYCRDGTLASFSYRVSEELEQLVIGADNYKPLCRKCYNKYFYI
jgi:thymidine kinase